MNWKNTIEDLLKRNYSFASIGREIGTTGAAVRAMMLNPTQQPRWETGQKIIALHRRALRKVPNDTGNGPRQAQLAEGPR